jgi:hypothetical protein
LRANRNGNVSETDGATCPNRPTGEWLHGSAYKSIEAEPSTLQANAEHFFYLEATLGMGKLWLRLFAMSGKPFKVQEHPAMVQNPLQTLQNRVICVLL